MIATVLAAEPAKPQMYQWRCPGPNGGWGWQVLEDRDGDGRYDWETRHECDGSICEGPLELATNDQIGYLSGWVSLLVYAACLRGICSQRVVPPFIRHQRSSHGDS